MHKLYIHIYIYTYLYISTHNYICIHMCIHICICIHTCLHIHTIFAVPRVGPRTNEQNLEVASTRAVSQQRVGELEQEAGERAKLGSPCLCVCLFVCAPLFGNSLLVDENKHIPKENQSLWPAF